MTWLEKIEDDEMKIDSSLRPWNDEYDMKRLIY